ncbi:hypothetical protein G2W53_001116 [Senna tora]|uniref:Uncharacterized protein n=1 Tax=Senna tora TaxID=362788 RepID=A0A835CIB6_9FABA|nr:hypothetical protein G2W53_001116 [Senna tora]
MAAWVVGCHRRSRGSGKHPKVERPRRYWATVAARGHRRSGLPVIEAATLLFVFRSSGRVSFPFFRFDLFRLDLSCFRIDFFVLPSRSEQPKEKNPTMSSIVMPYNHIPFLLTFSDLMMTPSVGDSSGKQYLRYKNAYYNCRKVACIKVLRSDANPNRLYVCCDNDECSFFRWFKPMKDVEVSSNGGIKMAATDRTTSLYVQRTSKIGSEVKLKDDFMMVKGDLTTLKTWMIAHIIVTITHGKVFESYMKVRYTDIEYASTVKGFMLNFTS